MKKTATGFRINKNGKVILVESSDVRQKEYKGTSYKEDGDYYFFKRKQDGLFIYSK